MDALVKEASFPLPWITTLEFGVISFQEVNGTVPTLPPPPPPPPPQAVRVKADPRRKAVVAKVEGRIART